MTHFICFISFATTIFFWFFWLQQVMHP